MAERLLERDAERAELAGFAEGLVTTGEGGAVRLEGVAGIGKSSRSWRRLALSPDPHVVSLSPTPWEEVTQRRVDRLQPAVAVAAASARAARRAAVAGGSGGSP
jgi:hypothetical protein